MIKACKVCCEEKEHKSWKATMCNDCLEAGLKWCSKCEEVKPTTEFHKNGKTLRSFCKLCECARSIADKTKSGYYTRPDVRARRNADSRKCKRNKYNNDESYRHAEIVRCHDRRNATIGTLTTQQWYAACVAFGYRCAYCGAQHNLTMDHVVPVALGGCTDVDNIIPACQSCNSSKQAKDMIEWYTAQPFYSKERLECIVKYLSRMKGGDAE